MKRSGRAQGLLPQLAVPVLLAIASAATAAPGPRTPPDVQSAVWRPYDLLIDLHDLPKSYTCDELYYKFWEVLWALGAEPNMKVLAYDCAHPAAGSPTAGAGRAVRAPERSPRVQLQFALPAAVRGSDTSSGDLQAILRTIRLAPGHPRTIDSADCALLAQIKDTLLPALPAEVVGSRLNCTEPSRNAHFSISIRALTPEKRASISTTAPVTQRLIRSASSSSVG